MDLYGTITDSHQIALSKEDAERRASFLGSCKPGAVVKETLSRHHPEKSHQQVKTIYGLLIETVKKGLDEMGFDLGTLFPTAQVPQGIPCPREVLMQVFYACCNDVGPDGERKTLSKMSTIEAAAFFDNCRDHAARTWGIIVPDPDPAWREKQRADQLPDVSPQSGSEGPADAKDAVKGVTDDASAGDLFADEGESKYVCKRCGAPYRVRPAKGKCVGNGKDEFPCGGDVIER